jgi:hypothetical protein
MGTSQVARRDEEQLVLGLYFCHLGLTQNRCSSAIPRYVLSPHLSRHPRTDWPAVHLEGTDHHEELNCPDKLRFTNILAVG